MHIIRLRGPWQLEVLQRFIPQPDGTYRPTDVDLPGPTKMKMPADWSAAFGDDFWGRVAYRRVFHWNTPLYETERVFLVVEPPRSHACITLKKKLVGFVDPGEPAGRFDITDRLEDDNELEIFVDHPAVELVGQSKPNALKRKVSKTALKSPGGLVGEVRLEIED
jgi:hypothetical protein